MMNRAVTRNSARLSGAVLLVAMFGGDAFGQAWTRAQGQGYVNVSLTTLSGDQLFGTDGETRDIANTYSQTIVGLYGELGLIDRWLTLSLNTELFRRNALEDLAATQGLGDLQVGLWSGLVERPFRLTVGVILGVPTGDDRPTSDLDDLDAELAANSLPTGDGEVDITPTIVFGTSFGGRTWPLRHFLTARAGYWLRTRGFSDGFTYQLELGSQVPVTFLERFWFTFRLRGVESFSRPSQGGFAGLGDGISYTSVSAEAYGRIWQSLGASVAFDTAFRATGIIAAAPLRFTLSYEF
ncbi:MAG: hypothetical protein AAF449_14805 [Myxococcota bacterium]